MKYFHWWFRWTVPPMPDATPLQRQQFFYARMISIFSLIILGSFIPAIPAILANTNTTVTAGIFVDGALIISGIILNRFRRRNLAGIAIILAILIVLTTTVVAQPLDAPQLSAINSFVLAVIIAGAILPPIAIPIVGCITSAIICLSILFLPREPAIQHYNTLTLLFPPMILQLVAASATFVIVRNFINASDRADRAEEIARLKDEIAEFEHVQALQKVYLEEGLYQIASVLAQIAQGHLSARVNISSSDVLWQIAGPLNNLLNRAENWRRDAALLQQTQLAAKQASQLIQLSLVQRRPIPFEFTGTPVDLVLIEFNKFVTMSGIFSRTL